MTIRIDEKQIENETAILGGDIESILGPQEALGASILKSIDEVVALVQEQPSNGIGALASRFKHAILRDKINILPVLKDIHERVQGCHVVAEYDVGDVGKTSLLILKSLTRINMCVSVLLLIYLQNSYYDIKPVVYRPSYLH